MLHRWGAERNERDARSMMRGFTADTLCCALVSIAVVGVFAANSPPITLVGTGAPGFSQTQVNNPYGLVIGPDGALYFCDLDNQRVRRFDLKTHTLTTVAGNGDRAY